VQLHGANGYLIDQFLRDNANFRDDDYGGSVENRIRLLDEVTGALVSEVGADRTSVRLSPNGNSQGVDDSSPEALFTAAAKALAARDIAFLELREPPIDGTFGATDVPRQSPAIRKVFPGPLVLNSDYDAVSGQAALDSGVADAISFGRHFLANPDLPARFQSGAALNEGEMTTWYAQGDAGYIDYPVIESVDA
jgi:N-ethylmaleimide reductase